MRSHDSINDASLPRPKGLRFSLRQLFLWVFCIGAVLAVLVAFADAVRTARRAALATAAQGPLNQLQLALLNYHDTYGQFPPAYVTDDSGAPMHSWRVLILPYAEQRRLYDAYDFTEPWNGPNNSKLANQMPQVFHSPSEETSETFTNIVAITGPRTAFPGNTSTTLSDFVDGPGNTILLSEITNSKVPWLCPIDLDSESAFTANAPKTLPISSARWRRPYVVFADHIRAYGVHREMPPESFEALTTIAGREPITRSDLISQGYLE